MDFDLVKNKVTGLPNTGYDVAKHLDELCEFMDMCLKDWLEYIQEQRSKFYEMNYFTMPQLVILRNEVAKLLDKEKPDPRVYQMLHIIRPDCTEQDLYQALESAWRDLQAKGDDDDDDSAPSVCGQDERSQFLQDLMEEGYSKNLALRAWEKFDDLDEGNLTITF